jgi:thiol-disulfide isomerase/thioredoxin
MRHDSTVLFELVAAQWCIHCKRLAPELQALAKALSGTASRVAQCDGTVNPRLRSALSVSRYPAIKWLHGSVAYTYASERHAAALQEFAEVRGTRDCCLRVFGFVWPVDRFREALCCGLILLMTGRQTNGGAAASRSRAAPL